MSDITSKKFRMLMTITKKPSPVAKDFTYISRFSDDNLVSWIPA